ncbi:MAG: hypothetical protein U1E76_21845 [Planctomycetota bacterium]
MVDVWEGRTRFATDQFYPTLRGRRRALACVRRAASALLGVSEIANLFFRDCDPRFVEAFTARDAEPALLQAFEEFLFDLPFESLERVRARMAEDQKSCVTREEVARYLGLEALRPMLDGPKNSCSIPSPARQGAVPDVGAGARPQAHRRGVRARVTAARRAGRPIAARPGAKRTAPRPVHRE